MIAAGVVALAIVGSLTVLGRPSSITTPSHRVTNPVDPPGSNESPSPRPTSTSAGATFLAGSAASSSTSEAQLALPLTASGQADAYVGPVAIGSGDGGTPTDAASIDRLNELVATVGPGGVIELAAGVYLVTKPVSLNHGGQPGAPVTIRGATGAAPELRGTRASPYDPAGSPGKPLFRLEAGADHLAFSHLRCTLVGNGCFLVAGPITDLILTGILAENVQRFFENQAGAGQSDATIAGMSIANVTITGFSKGALRIGYDSHDIRITDVVGDSLAYDGDNFAIGVHLVDRVHDVVMERVRMDNARDTLHDYWNGDGFAAERGVYNLLLIDTSASGNTDAGYDLKASDVRMVNAVAHDNKRNFRFWGKRVMLEACVGSQPHLRGGTGTQAQLHLAEAAQVEVVGCSFTDSGVETIVFDVDDEAQLVVRDTRVEYRGQLSTVEPGASIELEIDEQRR